MIITIKVSKSIPITKIWIEELEKPDIDLSDELNEEEMKLYLDQEVEDENNEKINDEEDKKNDVEIETEEDKKKWNEEKEELCMFLMKRVIRWIVKKKRKEVEDLYDELYKLDYEDMIGDQQFRFPYKEVPARDYGLTTEEILAADDKELRSYISIKRMTPYQEREYKVRKDKTRQFKKELHQVWGFRWFLIFLAFGGWRSCSFSKKGGEY